MRLSKKEAAQRLGISLKTLDKHLRSGLIPFEKLPDTIGNGWRGNSRVWIFLPDPEPVASGGNLPPRADVRVNAQYDDDLGGNVPKVAPSGERPERDRTFAERYLAGDASDSIGNRHDGVARKSLLGPTNLDKLPEPRDSNCTSHMTPGTVSQAGNERVENVIDSPEYMELIHPGHLERMAQLYTSCGIRPLSEQQQKEFNDRRQIQAAFRWAR